MVSRNLIYVKECKLSQSEFDHTKFPSLKRIHCTCTGPYQGLPQISVNQPISQLTHHHHQAKVNNQHCCNLGVAEVSTWAFNPIQCPDDKSKCSNNHGVEKRTEKKI